ncbi:MAG: dihydroneopterin aldolase [Acidimicrobiales bacterium]
MGEPRPAERAAPSDRVELRGLRVLGVHGVLPEERTRAQPFEVDVDLEMDLGPAGRSDSLADTVDYGAVVEAVTSVITGPHADLLEHLAERIAATVLVPPVSAVRVTVRKLRPPVPSEMASAGVTIRRAR